ncbi:cyclin-dependent kinase inhibitor 3-like isoform X2 [Primulina eburnea]|uniref:cyclin-dependent kinase inhibitor 3-like isoform X2 n=1 Tax=Primulina eburnea TaxID=1245227 RepID=UPI003C6BFB32
MGKYMRKAKTAGDTAVMEMSQSSPLGVRTRAKTLALQRLQSTAASTAAPPNDSCYLELRSRRLEKQPPPHQHNSREDQGLEHSEDRTREECCEAALISCSVGAGGLEIEASFGENNLDTEANRSTKEITPSNSTRAAGTPCSSTRKVHSRAPSQRLPLNAVFVNMPALHELEDFFAIEEQAMQRHFIEKYNFDFVNDSPLPGRYEWVKQSL